MRLLTLSPPIPLRLYTLPYWSNSPLTFDIQALWRSRLSARGPECQKLTSSSATAERPRELGDFKKARVNGGITITLLRIPTSVSAAADRPGNQTVSSTRPSCYIHLSTVSVINIVADHQMFRTLTGELS